MIDRNRKGQFLPGNQASKGVTEGKNNFKTKHEMWEELGEYIVNQGAQKYLMYIQSLEGEEFAKRFEALLEYFKPKQQRVENINTDAEVLEGFCFVLTQTPTPKLITDETNHSVESEAN